jgi:CheY-like chemotaxis protein
MVEQQLKNKLILIVDDEADLREIISSEFIYIGAKVLQAENVSQATHFLASNPIDLIISDIRMPGGTGIDLLKDVKTKNVFSPPMILMTGFADVSEEEAYHLGAEAFMGKPFKLEDLLEVACQVLTPFELRKKQILNESSKSVQRRFDEDFHSALLIHNIQLGRGGLTFIVRPNEVSFVAGNSLSFTLQFKDMTLSGSAICRWIKSEGSNDRLSVALEFINLSDSTLSFLNEYWKQHKIIPFIPRLN